MPLFFKDHFLNGVVAKITSLIILFGCNSKHSWNDAGVYTQWHEETTLGVITPTLLREE